MNLTDIFLLETPGRLSQRNLAVLGHVVGNKNRTDSVFTKKINASLTFSYFFVGADVVLCQFFAITVSAKCAGNIPFSHPFICKC
jgi:hypothetical protein